MRRVKTWNYRFSFRGCLLRALTTFCIHHGVMHTQKGKYVRWVTFYHIPDWNSLPLEWRLSSKSVESVFVLQNNQGLYLCSFKSNMHISFHAWIFTGAFFLVSKPCQPRSKNAMHTTSKIWPCLVYFHSELQQGEALISSACSYSYFTYCARCSLWTVHSSYTSQNKQISL